MVVIVRFVGAFRGLSGKDRLILEFESTVPLREVIKEIVEEMPKLRQVLVDPELEDPRPNTLILVNGKEISVLNGLETRLKDKDEIVFVPVVHGG